MGEPVKKTTVMTSSILSAPKEIPPRPLFYAFLPGQKKKSMIGLKCASTMEIGKYPLLPNGGDIQAVKSVDAAHFNRPEAFPVGAAEEKGNVGQTVGIYSGN